LVQASISAGLAESRARFQLLGQFLVGRQRRLPGVFAGEIAPMPLGPNRVHVANQPRLADRVDGVVVKNAVVPLMARRQNLVGLFRDLPHLLALMDTVPHELLGEHMLAGPHRLDRSRSMQMQRQGNHDRLDVFVGEEFLVGLVDLHVLAGLVLGRPLILGHQPRPSLVGARARHVAMEAAEDVVGTDVGDRDDIQIVGIVGPEQHAPLVASADHADPQRIADAFAVAEVDRAQPGSSRQAGRHRAGEEVAPRHADGIVEVFLPNLFLLF
jgi:hypothetical protein